MSDLTFLPWARAGAGAAVNSSGTAMGPNRLQFKVQLTVTQTLDSGTATPLSPAPVVALELLGPGDVTGLAPGQVIRTDPADGATGVDPTVFPAVEFAEATLPWLFTPAPENVPWPGKNAPAAGSHQLLPWICLVTVPDAPGITLDTAAGTLTFANPADAPKHLPDLNEAWAWAHVQYAGDLPADPGNAVTALTGTAGGTLSRLLSPRQLAADTRYHACVVPTFKAGRVTGLGGSPDPAAIAAPAWDITVTEQGAVTLPVYFSFSFTTGAGGDFQSLARLLVHPPQVSAAPDSGLGSRALTVGLPFGEKATSTFTLQVPGMLGPVLVNQPPPPPLPAPVEQAVQNEVMTNTADSLPELRATAYGAVQAGISTADMTPANWGTLPAWFQALNTDPRLRVAAALGRQVVAAQREQLVAAAWQQVSDTNQANALLSRAQLARGVTQRQLSKHLSPPDPLSFLQLTSPHASRVPLPADASTAGAVTGSVWSVTRDTPGTDPRLAAVTTAAYRRLARPRGPHARATATPAPPTVPFTIRPNDSVFDPSQTVPNRVFAERLSAQATAAAYPTTADPLKGFAHQVSYPAAMFAPLAALAQEAILPGASTIPPNTALILQPDPDMIVAYLAGLNTEISRLLLWRGVPVDPTATPFTYFWDQRGQGGGPPDIGPIAGWTPSATLGSQLASQSSGNAQVFLAVRAELFLRYPTTAVYAARANPPAAGSTAHTVNLGDIVPPTFTAILPPDLHLYGFPAAKLSVSAATTGDGFFFVFQQQVTETRFGSDALAKLTPPAGPYWPAAALAGLSPAPAARSDAIAGAVLQLPVLAAIHARLLRLPSGG